MLDHHLLTCKGTETTSNPSFPSTERKNTSILHQTDKSIYGNESAKVDPQHEVSSASRYIEEYLLLCNPERVAMVFVEKVQFGEAIEHFLHPRVELFQII